MQNIPQYVCAVIPPHMLAEVADHSTGDAAETARETLEHMRELASDRAAASLLERRDPVEPESAPPRKRRHVYDARNGYRLPGSLAMSEHKARSTDVEVCEAYDGCGATYDFFAEVFGRSSIDGKGMRLDSTVHYGERFANAFWNRRQMVYGNADGRIFKRFTAAVDVIAHELTHAVTERAAALGYHGQTGAVNEHLSDAFASMVKQYTLGQSVEESDWTIGDAIIGPDVNGYAVRSLALPGSAYDDPVLGRDPQPSHMRDYVHTTDDNGGVHINSGILNHAFYIAAMTIGGKSWEVLGRIWYAALTDRLKPEADFADFTQATFDIAGELYGFGGLVQDIVGDAWESVGLSIPLRGRAATHAAHRRPSQRAAAIAPLPKWRQRPAR